MLVLNEKNKGVVPDVASTDLVAKINKRGQATHEEADHHPFVLVSRSQVTNKQYEEASGGHCHSQVILGVARVEHKGQVLREGGGEFL